MRTIDSYKYITFLLINKILKKKLINNNTL